MCGWLGRQEERNAVLFPPHELLPILRDFSVSLLLLLPVALFFLTGYPAGVRFLDQTQKEQPHSVEPFLMTVTGHIPLINPQWYIIFCQFYLSEQTLIDLEGKVAVRCTKFTLDKLSPGQISYEISTGRKFQGGLRREAAWHMGPFLILPLWLGQVGGWWKAETPSRLAGKKGSRPHSTHIKMVIIGEKGSVSPEGGVIGRQKQMSTIPFLLSCFGWCFIHLNKRRWDMMNLQEAVTAGQALSFVLLMCIISLKSLQWLSEETKAQGGTVTCQRSLSWGTTSSARTWTQDRLPGLLASPRFRPCIRKLFWVS